MVSMRMLRCLVFALALLMLPALAGAAVDGVAGPFFSKSFSPATIGPGSVSTLTFLISNAELPTAVTDLAFTDTLPAGVTIANPPLAASTCGGSVSAPAGGSTIDFSGGSLGANAECTVTVHVTSATPGTHTNVSGPLTSSAGTGNTATADLTVDAGLPGFSKSFAPASIPLGHVSTLTLTIDNTADAANADLIAFTDVLPSGVAVANPANAATTCTGGVLPVNFSATSGSTSISMLFGFVAAGTTCTATVDVAVSTVGLHDNLTSNLSSSRGNSGMAAASLEARRDFLIKTFTDDPVSPGGTVTLEFTVNNPSRTDDLTDVAFTDDLDATLSGLVAIGLPLVDPCGTGSSLTGTSLLTFSGGNLPPEGSCTFDVTLQVPAGASAGTYPNTTSAPTATLGGAPVVEAPATDDLLVEPVPLLTKSFTDDPVVAGGTVTLEFTITNTDTGAGATGLSFTDDLGAVIPGLVALGLPLANPCGAGSTLSGPVVLSLTGGNLPAGGSCTFDVTLQVPAGVSPSTYPNSTSSITGIVGGTAQLGPAASDDLIVVAAPRLTKTFTDDPVLAGATVTLEFTLTNDESAPGSATGIAFTDDLGATLTGLVAVGLPANDICGTGSQISGTTLLSFSGGTLAPGESCTFDVTLQVPAAAAAGSYTNTTSTVTATSLGLAVTGIAASDDLQVAALAAAKSFTDDPVVPGATVTLQFALTNLSPTANVTNITFTDDLNAALTGLASTSGTVANVCGAGSQIAGTTLLIFTGGSLGPGASCTFSVTLQVPAGASPGEYLNRSSAVTADVDGSPVSLAGMEDTLTVTDALSISKSFTDDPVPAGGTVTLEFTISNAHPTQGATGITFTDDLNAALTGLASTSGTVANVCGAGSQIAGTTLLSFTGGSLGPASSCTFSVTLQVPAGVSPGTTVTNTTSAVTGTVGGVGVSGVPATDVLRIEFITFTKAFDGPSAAGATPTLTFTLQNLDPGNGVSGLSFTDDLNAVLPGLVATGLPATGVCGAGSQIAGTSLLTLTNGSLGPGGTCTFAVDLQVPGAATPGSYPNTTSDLSSAGLTVANPATDSLGIEPPPAFSKTFTPNSIGVGGVSMLSFLVDNTASALTASNLAFTDNLPAGVVVANPANVTNTCGGTPTATPGTGVISLTGGSVAAGASCTLQLDVTATTPGDHLNTTGDLTSSSGNSGPASDTLTANPQPGFSKSFAPDPIAPAGISTLTFTIDNSASTVAATDLVFSDSLPAGVFVANPANASTTCTGGSVTAAPGGGVISYGGGGSVAAGAACTVQADVTSSVAGTHVNVSGALSSSLGASGTATDDLTVLVGIVGLTKSFALTPVLRGGMVQVEFTVLNASPTFPLTAVAFTDDLDAALPGLVAVGLPAADVCGAGSQLSGTAVLALTGGSVPAGGSCTFSATLLVPTDAPLGVVTNTTSQITATAGGVAVSGPPASADVEVAFLDFSKAFAAGSVLAGSTTQLSFTLSNPDPGNGATGITFTDDLDAVLPGLVAVGLPAADVCGAGSQLTGTSLLTLTGGSLPAGGSCTFSVTVQVPGTAAAGSYNNVTSIVEAMVGGAPVAGDAAGAAQAVLVVEGNPTVIPTLGLPGLLLLAGLLAALAVWRLRRPSAAGG